MSVNSASARSGGSNKPEVHYQSIAALAKPPPAKPFVVSTVTDVQSLLDAGSSANNAGSSFVRQGSYGSNIDGNPKLVRKRSDLSPSTTTLDLSPSHLSELGCCGRVFLLIPRLHFRRLFELAVPSVIGSMLSVVINLVNLAFIGHLSPELLGGAALGNAFMLITGYCVLLGLCSSIDTLCAQAYGANQSKLVGLIAQRAAIAFTLVILPILAMWSRTESFFLSAGQDPELSRLAGEYVFYCLPTIFPILYSEIIKRYLQAQSIYAPQIYIALIANLVHACAAWLMMFHLSMGLAGASIGLCIGLSTNLVCWLLYLRFVNTRVYRRTCPRLNCREIFAGWGPLFRLGIPGCLMMLFEWAAFELCALGAGWLGEVQLDTIIVFSNLCTFLTMAPSGIAISTSTLVAHAVGGGKSEHARLYAHAAGCLILVFAITESIVLGILHNYLVHVFTEDAAVAKSFRNISFCVAIFVMFDCYQTVEGGVLRGLGYQSFGASVNGLVFYAFGLPLGFTLAFYFKVGVPGLVVGLVTCVVTQTLVFLWKLDQIDWEQETTAAAQRIESEKPDASLIEAAKSLSADDEEDDEDYDEESRHNRPEEEGDYPDEAAAPSAATKAAADRKQHGFS